MINFIKNVILTGLSYLSSNRVPPNTPMHIRERLRTTNHMESKKFYIVITSVVILAFFYFSSIGLLFIIPNAPEFISGFVTIFSKTIEILAIIIASYVGAQAVVDLRYQSGSNVDLESATVKEEEEVTVLHTNMKEDDYELK
jgi:hypothetical protein